MAQAKKDLTIIAVEPSPSISQKEINFVEGLSNLLELENKPVVVTDLPSSYDRKSTRIFNCYHNLASQAMRSYTILTQIHKYIKTSHYLLVPLPPPELHNYVNYKYWPYINYKRWLDEFLDYHFIGRPRPLHPAGYIPPHTPITETNRVGYGHFSVRSVRMMKYIEHLFIEMSESYTFSPEIWEHEDLFITTDIREILESKGFRFAPIDVALKFSSSEKANSFYTDLT